jgi:hypothetical protein
VERRPPPRRTTIKKLPILIVGVVTLLLLSPAWAQAQGQYVDGSIGVDVSFPNGSATIPGGVAFGVVGVTDGLVYSDNPYLAAEASHFSNLSLYVNTGLNASSSSSYYQAALAQANGDPVQAAYDYGYNAGLAAVQYAQSQGVTVAETFWLDVETANTWNANTAWNQQSLQGEHDALLASDATTVGVYSTTAQWAAITGGWQNLWPNWGATTFTTSGKALGYSTGHGFTGGPTVLLQYRPTGATIDYDVACPAVPLTARLSLRLGGLRHGVLRRGRRLTMKAHLTPSVLAGSRVRFVLERRRHRHWYRVLTRTRTTGSTGRASASCIIRRGGTYRVWATIAKAGANTAARSRWHKVVVR